MRVRPHLHADAPNGNEQFQGAVCQALYCRVLCEIAKEAVECSPASAGLLCAPRRRRHRSRSCCLTCRLAGPVTSGLCQVQRQRRYIDLDAHRRVLPHSSAPRHGRIPQPRRLFAGSPCLRSLARKVLTRRTHGRPFRERYS